MAERLKSFCLLAAVERHGTLDENIRSLHEVLDKEEIESVVSSGFPGEKEPGAIGDTVIGDGVKIAPSTHIGHNNWIGPGAVIITLILYGSVRIGDGAYVAGSTIRNQCSVGSHALVGIGSVVTKDVPDHVTVVGCLAKELKK